MSQKKPTLPNVLQEYFLGESDTLIKDIKKIINSDNTSNYSVLESVFQEIPDSLISNCLNAILGNFQTDLSFEYRHISRSNIILYSDRDFSLSIRPINSVDEILSIEPMHCFYKTINNGTLNYKKFAVDQDIKNDEFSHVPRLRMVDVRWSRIFAQSVKVYPIIDSERNYDEETSLYISIQKEGCARSSTGRQDYS